jgi:hypothetical protein
VRRDDVLTGREQLLDHVGRIVDHVNIEPQHPLFVLQSRVQQPIASTGEHDAPGELEGRDPALNALGKLEVGVPPSERHSTVALAQRLKPPPDLLVGAVGAVALQQPDAELAGRK